MSRCTGCGALAALCLCPKPQAPPAPTHTRGPDARCAACGAPLRAAECDWQRPRCDTCGSLEALCACPPAASAPAISLAPGATARVRTLHRFNARQEGDLDLDKGQIVTVTSTGDDGWWTGECGGARGTFPASYVEAVADDDDGQRQRQREQQRGCATCGGPLRERQLEWQLPRCAACGSFESLCLCQPQPSLSLSHSPSPAGPASSSPAESAEEAAPAEGPSLSLSLGAAESEEELRAWLRAWPLACSRGHALEEAAQGAAGDYVCTGCRVVASSRGPAQLRLVACCPACQYYLCAACIAARMPTIAKTAVKSKGLVSPAASLTSQETSSTAAPAEQEDSAFPTHCVVCRVGLRAVLFAPCHHFVCCAKCSADQRHCPKCSARITSLVEVRF
eukprot:m51a1_g5793 hypothetical protein (393) ;mRNA; r:39449-40781